MPAAAPRPQGRCPQRLQAIGAHIRQRRRHLGVTALATAAAAGISRVTLHRIETGAASVRVGALMNVLDALDLPLSALEGELEGKPGVVEPQRGAPVAESIELAAYPLLRQLAWHVHGTGALSAAEAAALYARQRRGLDLEQLLPHERELITALQQAPASSDVQA
ncbi:MAG: helix-turn-helix domain-containing protein [Cyanobium sp.]|jgi:transcriptional regulator with XRE-family HTH domain